MEAFKSLVGFSAIVCSLVLLAQPTKSSYAFYIGKDLTEDGSVLVGGTGEEVSSHWLQVFPATVHAPNETILVGVTEDAVLPGELIQIPQVNRTFRYMSMEYSDFEGFPAPLTNGGLNDKGVAVRDVWCDSRTELVNMTPNPQRGLQYSDLARVVLQCASTAREGVELIGDLIEKYGYADYGGNSHLIADKDEGWVVIQFSGGQKLWAAERLGSSTVRVLYPGYIEDFRSILPPTPPTTLDRPTWCFSRWNRGGGIQIQQSHSISSRCMESNAITVHETVASNICRKLLLRMPLWPWSRSQSRSLWNESATSVSLMTKQAMGRLSVCETARILTCCEYGTPLLLR